MGLPCIVCPRQPHAQCVPNFGASSSTNDHKIDMDSVRRNLEVAFDTAWSSERRYEDSRLLELPPLSDNSAYDIIARYSYNSASLIWVAKGSV